MEMNNKIKNNNKRTNKKEMRRGPHSEQRWGILKYLSAEISSEKSEIIQD